MALSLLALTDNNIGDEGALALLNSEALHALKCVNLIWNPIQNERDLEFANLHSGIVIML